MTTRRTIAVSLAAAGLLLLTSACGSSASSAPGATTTSAKVTLGLVQGQDYIHAMPARVAEAQGFFAKDGLNVSIVDFHAGSDLTKAMAGGSVNVGAATGLDAVSAAAHGVNLQAFFGVEAKSPMALVVPTNSTIHTFGDLKGKRVAISKVGSLTDYTVRAALTAANVPLTDVKEIPLGDPASTMAGLARGDVDAFVLPVNFGYVVEAKGTGKIAQIASDAIGGNDQFAILMAEQSYIAANEATLKKMANVYTDALTWMKNNKDATVQLAVTKLGMSQPIAVKTYEATMGNFTPDGKINATGMASYATALPKLGIATAAPKEATYLNTSITGTN